MAAAGSVLASCTSESGGPANRAAAGVLPGEEDAFSCTDESGLTEQQVQTRRALKYVDKSPHSDKRCNNCQFFQKPARGESCGRCTVVPGPVHPRGHCTSWAAPV